LSNKGLLIFPTFAKIYESVAAMSALNDVTRGILTKLKDLLTSTDDTIDIAVGQITSISTVPYQYLINQLQAAIANNQALIDAAVSDTITKIRYSKLDNPLCHLFKKNKVVDTLQGELSWTRDGGATYIDQYRKLQYSPSPYATNLCLHSEDLSEASWVKEGVIATNVFGRYVKNILLNRLEADSSGVGKREIKQTVVSSFTGRATYSFYIAADQVSDIIIRFDMQTVSDCRVRFNVEDEFYAGNTNAINQNFSLAVTSKSADGSKRVFISIDVPISGNITTTTWLTDQYQSIGHSSTLDIGDGLYLSAIQLEKSKVANGYVKTLDTSASGKSYVGIDITRQEKDGYKIEDVSTNQFPISADFINGFNSSTIAIELAPTEDLTNLVAYKAIPGVTNSIKSLVQHYTAIAGDTQTFTIIAKSLELSKIQIGSNYVQSSAYQLVKVDFASGEIISGGEHVTQFKKIEGGAYILSVTFLTDIGGLGAPTLQIYSNAGDQKWASDGVSGMCFYFTQIEPLSFPSSLIFTDDSPATRAADFVFCPTYENVPNTNEPWSLVVWSNPYRAKAYSSAFTITDASGQNVIAIANNTTSHYGQVSTDKGSVYVGIGSTNLLDEIMQLAITYDGEYLSFFVNGIQMGYKVRVNGAISGVEGGKIIFPRSGSYTNTKDFRLYDFDLSANELSFLTGE
jgi:hypothetical protein